jgi:hypothetical protein
MCSSTSFENYFGLRVILELFYFILYFLTQMENSIATGKPVHCERWGNSTLIPKT